MRIVARLASALALYLAGVAGGLLVLFAGCGRCQQDNAYLGLGLLPLLLTALAGVLAASGLVLARGRGPWLLVACMVGVPSVMLGALAVLRFPAAAWLTLVGVLGASLPPALRLGGARITAVTLGAAAVVALFAHARGVQAWGVDGFDLPVLTATLLLGLPLGWLTFRRREET